MKAPHSEMVRTALRPASVLWGVVSRSRNLMYDHGIAAVRRLPVPVVSIGNITVGGTGKTPMTIHLAQHLMASGLRPLVLSRGYASKGYGTRVVSDGRQVFLGPEEAGDEPVMIARSVPGLPVVVDPNRLRGGYAAVRRFSPDIVLLDDGFQHRRLARDLDIVLLDAVDPFGRYALLPSGFLREPFSGLVRADFFVVTHAPEGEPLATLTGVLRRYNSRAPILRATHRPDSLLPVESFTENPGPHARETAASEHAPPGEPVAGGSLHAKAFAGASPRAEAPAGPCLTAETLAGASLPAETLAGPCLAAGALAGASLPIEAPASTSLPTEDVAGVSLPGEDLAGASLPVEALAGASVFAFCGVGNPDAFRMTLQRAGARLVGFEAFRDHHRFTPAEIRDLKAAAARATASLIMTTEKDAVRIAEMPAASGIYALRIQMEIPEAHSLLDAILSLVRA